MGDFLFFRFSPKVAPKSGDKIYVVRVPKSTSQGRLRVRKEAEEWATTLFERAIAEGSIRPEKKCESTGQVEPSQISEKWTVVVSFGPSGAVPFTSRFLKKAAQREIALLDCRATGRCSMQISISCRKRTTAIAVPGAFDRSSGVWTQGS